MSLANYNLDLDPESNNLNIKHGAIHAVCQLTFMVYPQPVSVNIPGKTKLSPATISWDFTATSLLVMNRNQWRGKPSALKSDH